MQPQQAWNQLLFSQSPEAMELKGIWSVVLGACALSCGLALGAEDALDSRAGAKSGKIDDRGRLIRDLLKDYDNRNYPSNITAKFGLSILQFKVDETEDSNAILANVWLRMVWTDSRLSYDPAEYGGVSVLRIPSREIWKPDIMLYNTDSGPDGMVCKETNALIYPSGQVLNVPPCKLRAHCNLTLDSSPLGEQHCDLKFGSWTLDGYTMDLEIYSPETSPLEDFNKSPRWDITDVKATRNEKKYDCCPEPYVSINYNITFHRRQA